MRFRNLILLLAITLIFFPRFSQIYAFEHLLWTTQEESLGRLKNNDLYLHFGKPIESKVVWSRIRLGLPLAPITIDYYNGKSLSLHIRVETLFLIVLLFLVSMIILCSIFINSKGSVREMCHEKTRQNIRKRGE